MGSIIGQILFLVPSVIFCFLATYNFIIYRKVSQPEQLGSLNPEGVSIYVPVFNDYQIMSSLLPLSRLNYPNFEVKILDDSTDLELISKIEQFVSNHSNFSVIRRSNRSGFKGGAIENALKDEKQRFICVLDCDFRPDNNFLNQIVRAIEVSKSDVLQGYPRHIRGSENLLGTFYRASQAASIVCLFGRYRLHLAPILYGSCFMMKTETAKKVGFNGKSITEDINFSIRAYSMGNFGVTVCPNVFANGGCPATFRDFVTQQLRWCEGTIRDVFLVNFKAILKIRSWKKKIDLIVNGLHFSSGFFLLLAFASLLFGAVNPFVGLFVTIYTTIGFVYPLMLGASMEKYDWMSKTKTLIFGLFLVYVMCPIMAYGFVKGLTSKKGSFKVTQKR